MLKGDLLRQNILAFKTCSSIIRQTTHGMHNRRLVADVLNISVDYSTRPTDNYAQLRQLASLRQSRISDLEIRPYNFRHYISAMLSDEFKLESTFHCKSQGIWLPCQYSSINSVLFQKQIDALRELCVKAGVTEEDIQACAPRS